MLSHSPSLWLIWRLLLVPQMVRCSKRVNGACVACGRVHLPDSYQPIPVNSLFWKGDSPMSFTGVIGSVLSANVVICGSQRLVTFASTNIHVPARSFAVRGIPCEVWASRGHVRGAPEAKHPKGGSSTYRKGRALIDVSGLRVPH